MFDDFTFPLLVFAFDGPEFELFRTYMVDFIEYLLEAWISRLLDAILSGVELLVIVLSVH